MAEQHNLSNDSTLSYLINKSSKEASAELDAFKNTFLNLVYPVGSIYISVSSANPGTLFGGTWQRITGRFLLAATDNGASGASQKAGNTGGAATINIEHAHTTGGHKLTVSEMPSHSHDMMRQQWYGNDAVHINDTGAIYSWKGGAGTGGSTSKSYHAGTQVIFNTGGGGSHSHGNTGKNLSTAQSIMPPYLAVYMWKRTA